MVDFNSVLLLGRLTEDPEVRKAPDGSSTCRFRLAVAERSRRRGGHSGESGESVCLVSVEAQRTLAEVCSKYLTKGREVFVLGKLRYGSEQTSDGARRCCLTVVARSVQFMGGPAGARPKTETADPVPSDD